MRESVPGFIKKIYPRRIWDGPAQGRSLYLTFDDGPVPGVTPWVLEQLKAYHAKATFFCIGENVRQYPEIFRNIIDEGHSIGNHTYNHLNGWKTSTAEYLLNTLKCRQVIHENYKGDMPAAKELFRPPYGKIKSRQARELLERDFRIVMWSTVSMDYDTGISRERCYRIVERNARPGSIIVFHDSHKARPNLENVLPRVLEYFSRLGYQFKALE